MVRKIAFETFHGDPLRVINELRSQVKGVSNNNEACKK
jgi:hypothetical protein